MSVLPLKFPRNYSLFSFALLTGFLGASSAQAAVPAVVVDSQQAIGSGYNNPQSIAVSKNGTIFVADSDDNQIVVLTSDLPFPGANATATTTPYVLTAPKALAMEAPRRSSSQRSALVAMEMLPFCFSPVAWPVSFSRRV